jgi:hypothetical protein
MKEAGCQFDLTSGGDLQASVRAQLNPQFDRGGRFRELDFDEGWCRWGLGPTVTPAAKGRVADAMLSGKGGRGQSAPIKRGQKLVSSAEWGARPTVTRQSIGVLHAPACSTSGRRATGGLSLTAYRLRAL